MLLYTVLGSDNDTKKQPQNNLHICCSLIFPGQINKLPHVLFLIPQVLFFIHSVAMNIGPYFFLYVHKPCSWLQHSLCMDVSAAFSSPDFSKGTNWPSLLQKPHVLFSWRVSLQWSLKVYGGDKEGRWLQLTTWGWYPTSWLLPHLTRHWEGTAQFWLFCKLGQLWGVGEDILAEGEAGQR